MLIQRFDATHSYDVWSHLLHCRLALIEAVGNFSAARRFANCTYLSKDAVAVVRTSSSPLSYRRTSFAILRTERVPFAADESGEDRDTSL